LTSSEKRAEKGKIEDLMISTGSGKRGTFQKKLMKTRPEASGT